VQPAKSSNDIQRWGEKSDEMQKTLIPRKKYENVFKEFDLAYLDGATPEGETEETYGMNANYRLLPPRNQNLCITIYFEKIVKDGGAK
jgi:hypothetical protein